MKNSIRNAKVVVSKFFLKASCQVEIARAVVSYSLAEFRLKRLHAVRDAEKREAVGYKARANRFKFEMAIKKLMSI